VSWKKKFLLLFCTCSILLFSGCATNRFARGPDADLYGAILNDNLEAAKAALDAGARVNQRNDRGETPLTYAALMGSPKTIKFLLDNGADVNIRNSKGWTALMRVSMFYSKSQAGPVSPKFTVEAFLEKGKLLLDRGADINARTLGGATALVIAASAGTAELLKLLVDRGAKYPEQPVLVLGVSNREWGLLREVRVMVQSDGPPRELYNSSDTNKDIDGRTLTIKPGVYNLRVIINEDRGEERVLRGVKHFFASGKIGVTFNAGKMGIYVVRYETQKETWQAWVSSYEP
jgi:ankyrin repeat protein